MSPGMTALLGLVIRSVPIGNGCAAREGKLQGGEGALMEPSCTRGGEDPGGEDPGGRLGHHQPPPGPLAHFKTSPINTYTKEHGIEEGHHVPCHAPAANKVEKYNRL